MEIWRREKGSTILLAILVLAVGSALVISLAQTKQNSITSVLAEEKSARALDLAESGLESVFQQIRAGIGNGSELEDFDGFEPGEAGFGGGTFFATVELLDADRLQITSSGSFENTTRVVRQVLFVDSGFYYDEDSWVAGAGKELDIKNPVDGSFYYAGKKLKINDNAGGEGTIYTGVGPDGDLEENITNKDWDIVEIEDPPAPPEIDVRYGRARQDADVSFSSTCNWDAIPENCKNKVVYVEGDININAPIKFEGNFDSLTIIAKGSIRLNGDAKVSFNSENASLNLVAGGNLHINGTMTSNFDTAQAFFYSEKTVYMNKALSDFNCRVRAEENIMISDIFDVYAGEMEVDIPGVFIGGKTGGYCFRRGHCHGHGHGHGRGKGGGGQGNGEDGITEGSFIVESWQELDPESIT